MEMMFASFQDLPLELRLKVWQYACRNNPRDVVVYVVKVEEEEQQEQQEQIALEGQPSDDGVYEYGHERGGSEQEAVFAAASTALSASSSSSSSSEEEEEDEHVRVDYIAKTAVPGILHVNHEAREQGLRFYRTCFSTEDAFPSEAQHQHQHQQPQAQAQAQHGYEPPYEGESRRHVYMNPGIDTLYIRLRREWGFVGNLVRGVHVRDWLNVAFFGRTDPDEPPASTRIWDRLRSMRASGYDFDDGVQIIVLGNCTTVLGELPGERRRKLISLGLLSDSVADPVRCIRTAAIERSTAWDRLFATY